LRDGGEGHNKAFDVRYELFFRFKAFVPLTKGLVDN
jgi:hypothetical protein